MTLVADVVLRIQAIVRDDHLPDDHVLMHLQTRYEAIYETHRWAHARRECFIRLVAQVDATTSDTVTVTEGSSTVTSAGTPFTAAMDGRMIQLADEPTPFYLTYSTSSVVTLQDGEGTAVVWPRASGTDVEWRIFQTQYALPTTGRDLLWLGTDIPIPELDGGRVALNRLDPHRETVNDQPSYWCYAGTTTSGVRQIEVWPVPSTSKIVRGEMTRLAPTLTPTTTLDLPVPVMVYAGAAECLNSLFTLTGDADKGDRAIFYERKAGEILNDYLPLEQSRQSTPRHFGRSSMQSLGADYWTTHDDMER